MRHDYRLHLAGQAAFFLISIGVLGLSIDILIFGPDPSFGSPDTTYKFDAWLGAILGFLMAAAAAHGVYYYASAVVRMRHVMGGWRK